MITIELQERTINFNLKNYEREQSLYNAWYSMHNDNKFEDKAIKITTDRNEKLELKIKEIISCKFEEAIHVIGEVQTKKPKKKPDFYDDPMDNILKNLNKDKEAREKENIKRLLVEMKKQNIPINLKDPHLQSIINSVKQDKNVNKIPLYISLYRASKGM